MKYDFQRKDTPSQTVFVLTLNHKKLTERIVIAEAGEALNLLNGVTGDVYYDQTRPLGQLLFDFESDMDNKWEQNAATLRESYNKTFPFEGERWKIAQPALDFLRGKYDSGGPDVTFCAVRFWEQYLYCYNQNHGAELFSRNTSVLYRPFVLFGQHKPWSDEDAGTFIKPATDVETQVELWYPAAKRPFECVAANLSLMPIISYYLNKIREWYLVYQECMICGKMFLARTRHYEICSDACRKIQAVEAKRQYDERTKNNKAEQDYESAYYYWSNRIRRLKRHNAVPDKITAAQAAFSDFRKEALLRKSEVKCHKMETAEFSSWLRKKQDVIDHLTE